MISMFIFAMIGWGFLFPGSALIGSTKIRDHIEDRETWFQRFSLIFRSYANYLERPVASIFARLGPGGDFELFDLTVHGSTDSKVAKKRAAIFGLNAHGELSTNRVDVSSRFSAAATAAIRAQSFCTLNLSFSK